MGMMLMKQITVQFILYTDSYLILISTGSLSSRLVRVLDSGAKGPGFKSQPQSCQVTVSGKLFTPIVPLFTKQQN